MTQLISVYIPRMKMCYDETIVSILLRKLGASIYRIDFLEIGNPLFKSAFVHFENMNTEILENIIVYNESYKFYVTDKEYWMLLKAKKQNIIKNKKFELEQKVENQMERIIQIENNFSLYLEKQQCLEDKINNYCENLKFNVNIIEDYLSGDSEMDVEELSLEEDKYYPFKNKEHMAEFEKKWIGELV
jgi:hypothetical protein